MTLSRWITVLGLLLLSGCTSHINAPETQLQPKHTGFEERLNVRYTPEGWPRALYADVYVAKDEVPGPAVLVVHGGGWQDRSRSDMTNTARELARHGFTAINIDYRFAPQYRYPAQLRDLQQALAWIRDPHR